MPKVLIPLAQGCEELEAVTIIDLLRRANIEVVSAGLNRELVKASRGVALQPDTTLKQATKMEDFDMIVLPAQTTWRLPRCSLNRYADSRRRAFISRLFARRPGSWQRLGSSRENGLPPTQALSIATIFQILRVQAPHSRLMADI